MRLPIFLLAFCGLLSAAHAQLAPTQDVETVVTLLELVLEADPSTAEQSLDILAEKVQSGELAGAPLERLRARLDPKLEKILEQPQHPLHGSVSLLMASWNHARAVEIARQLLREPEASDSQRLEALDALIAADADSLLADLDRLLARPKESSAALRGAALAALGRLESPRVAEIVLGHYEQLEEAIRPKAIELLTQRSAWSKRLLRAIGEGRVPKSALNVNQLRNLLASGDDELQQLIAEHWGSVRAERDEQREQVIRRMDQLLSSSSGDPQPGQQVFRKVCGQCHKLYGEGEEVGPDITRNGRSTFEQLLSNVFDPSLVIGAAYQAHTVLTADGRLLSGLLVEESPSRVVLKLQGGKTEVIPRGDVEEMVASPVSLMPEGLENQLSPQEIADLFAFLTLDGPPSEPSAQIIPGTPPQLHRR